MMPKKSKTSSFISTLITYAKKFFASSNFVMRSKALAYGNVNARIRAWKSKMIRKKDLELMAELKSFYSVVDILQKSTYGDLLKKELEETNSEVVINNIERVLWHSLNMQFLKIESMVSKQDKEILTHIFKYYDPKDMRTVLLGKYKKLPFEEIKTQTFPVGIIDTAMFEQIYKSKSFKDIIEVFEKTIYYNDIVEYYVKARKTDKEFNKNFFLDYERIIDFCNYFEFLVYDKYITYVPYSDNSVKKIIKTFREYVDGLNYLKLVEAQKENRKFSTLKLFRSGNMNLNKAKRLYESDKDLRILLTHEMRKLFSNSYDTTKLEALLNKYFYTKLSEVFKTETLRIGSVAGYMFMKLHEYSSILAIIKAKRYGLSKEEIYLL
ncbi:MAG: V-type ATPase subunit [Candidatus Micrarchaeota archaeon]|nr:V-type ATPase subunit [Candidatus Micrarchaeota archaeon]